MSVKETSRFVKTFGASALALLLLVGLFVMLVDPFYHYHGPWFGLKPVVNKAEYQCIGTVRHFDYDGILLGSSIAENYNNRWFDEAFGGTTIKGIKSSATMVDLVYYLQEAFATHSLKRVYYCMDTGALESNPDKIFPSEDLPLYLYDHNPVNDIQYLWNKDVIFENVPYLLATNLQKDYDEGTSYNWAATKSFSEADALSHYWRMEEAEALRPREAYADNVERNLEKIGSLVKAHPETEFDIIFSPFSILWWDERYLEGSMEQTIYALSSAMEYLLSFENVKIYYFMDDVEVVTDLNNYMDNIHFSMDINKRVVDLMAQGKCEVTKENYEQVLAHTVEMVTYAETELFPKWYPVQEGEY